MSHLDAAVAALKLAETNQCGCLGDSLARAIGDLEDALATERGYLVVRPGRDRPWMVGDWADVFGPVDMQPSPGGP